MDMFKKTQFTPDEIAKIQEQVALTPVPVEFTAEVLVQLEDGTVEDRRVIKYANLLLKRWIDNENRKRKEKKHKQTNTSPSLLEFEAMKKLMIDGGYFTQQEFKDALKALSDSTNDIPYPED